MPQPCSSKNSINLEKTNVNNSNGLCYKCGGNFKPEEHDKTKIYCDLCDKTFHKKCVNNI